MRNLQWQYEAWSEYTEIAEKDKAMTKKIHKLLQDIMRHGYASSYGKIEKLRGNLSGLASVRIDQKNRIIFSVDEFSVTIIQCGSHYNDK